MPPVSHEMYGHYLLNSVCSSFKHQGWICLSLWWWRPQQPVEQTGTFGWDYRTGTSDPTLPVDYRETQVSSLP